MFQQSAPSVSAHLFKDFVFMLSVRVSGFGTRVLPPTRSWATYLWANNIVPCRGTGARGKVKWKSTQGIHFYFFRNVMLLRSCC